MGEIADWLVDQMFEDEWRRRRWDGGDTYRRPPREATEVAEERLEDVASDKKVRDLNKGVIDW